MIPQTCLLIKTRKFPILVGEDDEVTNEHMYGKALCKYLESELPTVGIDVPFFCNEDWGWWLEVQRGAFKMGLCIYSDPDARGDPERYAVMPSMKNGKSWSWSRFSTVDVAKDVLEVIDVVAKLLTSDKDIPIVTRHDDYPF